MTKNEMRNLEAIRYMLEMQRCRCFLKEWPRVVRKKTTREDSWGISPNVKRNCRWRKLVRAAMWWNGCKWRKWRKEHGYQQ
mgnify:CR=1 FL=1|nr:MAG TPA: hypothetical protein [Caudoviricetes sp.]